MGQKEGFLNLTLHWVGFLEVVRFEVGGGGGGGGRSRIC